jgi:hypothetical protein
MWALLSERDIYRPLNAQQAEHESKPGVPSASLVYDTVGAKDVFGRVHLVDGCLGQQANDNYCGCVSLHMRENKNAHEQNVVPRLMKTKLVASRAKLRVRREF